jgi:hypothetical protein
MDGRGKPRRELAVESNAGRASSRAQKIAGRLAGPDHGQWFSGNMDFILPMLGGRANDNL